MFRTILQELSEYRRFTQSSDFEKKKNDKGNINGN